MEKNHLLRHDFHDNVWLIIGNGSAPPLFASVLNCVEREGNLRTPTSPPTISDPSNRVGIDIDALAADRWGLDKSISRRTSAEILFLIFCEDDERLQALAMEYFLRECD